MRARTLLLFGALIGLISALVTIATAAGTGSSPVEDDGSFGVALGAGGAVGLACVAVIALLAGWFGRERDDALLVTLGLGAVVVLGLGVTALGADGPILSAVVIGVAYALAAWVLTRLAWGLGDMICDVRGFPTVRHLTAPAYPEEGGPFWTTEAGRAIRRNLGVLAGRLAADGAADAQAVGIWVAYPRDRPILVALAGGRLGVQPVDLTGEPTGEVTVLSAPHLQEVSIRSEAADGSTRRQINRYDDVIDITTSMGDRLRLRLPYGSRGAGTKAGGPEVIRSWLRTHAATYR